MALITIINYPYSIEFDAGDLSIEFDYTYNGSMNKACIANVWHKYDDSGDYVRIVRSDGLILAPITFDLVDSVDGEPVNSNAELVEKINIMLRTRS